MRYDAGLQSVNRSDVIILRLFEEGYNLTNKNYYAKSV